jgi:hypothetical protein
MAATAVIRPFPELGPLSVAVEEDGKAATPTPMGDPEDLEVVEGVLTLEKHPLQAVLVPQVREMPEVDLLRVSATWAEVVAVIAPLAKPQ